MLKLAGRRVSRSASADEEELRPCSECLRCVAACPSGSLQYRQRMWFVDLGLCSFCGACARVCPNPLISAGRPKALSEEIVGACRLVTQEGSSELHAGKER